MVNQAERISWQLGQHKHAHSSTQHCQYLKINNSAAFTLHSGISKYKPHADTLFSVNIRALLATSFNRILQKIQTSILMRQKCNGQHL
jgi:hypothetical protein